jgi:hypothetical protein
LEVAGGGRGLQNKAAVIMAVPDEGMIPVVEGIVGGVDPGTVIMFLDPAAAYSGELPAADHVSYFVTHPCHPSFFTAETRLSDENPDLFGGQGRDPQDIVCALQQGTDADYELGEAIARDIFAPVRNSHRLTVDQMALLEPPLVESLLDTCLFIMKEGLDHVVEKGVPRDAAEDFFHGHMRVSYPVAFGYTDFPFSDGALQAVEKAKDDIFVDDWKEETFGEENVDEVVEMIVRGEDR